MNAKVKHDGWMREAVGVTLIGAGLVLLLPLILVVAVVARFGLLAGAIVAAVAGTLAYAVSPRFREWIGFKVEPGLTYNGLRLDTDAALDRGHGWVRFTGREALIGADDLAQAVLGPVEHVELPAPGAAVRRGECLFRLHRGDRTVAVPSPLTGTVIRSNEALDNAPETINASPFDDGWVTQLDCRRRRVERRELLRGAEARGWYRGQVDRLLEHLHLDAAAGAVALPDGGALVRDLYRHIDDETWARISADLLGGRSSS